MPFDGDPESYREGGGEPEWWWAATESFKPGWFEIHRHHRDGRCNPILSFTTGRIGAEITVKVWTGLATDDDFARLNNMVLVATRIFVETNDYFPGTEFE